MGRDLLADRLVCGTSVVDLLATVTDGVPAPDPEHSARCPHCRAALDRLETDWRLVRETAAVEVPPQVGVERRVLRRVRALMATGWATTGDGGLGHTSVSEAALALVAEYEAAGVRGIANARATRAEVGDGEAVWVRLELTVRWLVRIDEAADEVRRVVAHRIQVVTGLVTERVDVVVNDVRHD